VHVPVYFCFGGEAGVGVGEDGSGETGGEDGVEGCVEEEGGEDFVGVEGEGAEGEGAGEGVGEGYEGGWGGDGVAHFWEVRFRGGGWVSWWLREGVERATMHGDLLGWELRSWDLGHLEIPGRTACRFLRFGSVMSLLLCEIQFDFQDCQRKGKHNEHAGKSRAKQAPEPVSLD